MHNVPARRGRAATAGALLVAAAVLASACGTDDDDATSSDPVASESESPATEPAADAFPATVVHQYGETVIEEEPERIVTVGLIEQDALLALGVAPVATTEWFGEHPGSLFPWATDRLEELDAELPASLGTSASLNT